MRPFRVVCLTLAFATMTGCGNRGATGINEDASASGAVAEAIGGALSATETSGTQARWTPDRAGRSPWEMVTRFFNPLTLAFAGASACPTFRSLDSNCSIAGATMWLGYSNCTYGGGNSWSGYQSLTFSGGSNPACGSPFFPAPTNGTVIRQYVNSFSSTTPAGMQISTGLGSGLQIDDASTNLANFDSATIATLQNGGYGEKVTYVNGNRTAVLIQHHTNSGSMIDRSINGTLSIAESSSNTYRGISGTITVYDNILRVVGSSSFSLGATHSDSCCVPTSGSITTVFAQGSNVVPTAAGATWVGKIETLNFNGCGTATLRDPFGNTSSVVLTRCF